MSPLRKLSRKTFRSKKKNVSKMMYLRELGACKKFKLIINLNLINNYAYQINNTTNLKIL